MCQSSIIKCCLCLNRCCNVDFSGFVGETLTILQQKRKVHWKRESELTEQQWWQDCTERKSQAGLAMV